MARAIRSMVASLSGDTVGGGIVVGGVEFVCAKKSGSWEENDGHKEKESDEG